MKIDGKAFCTNENTPEKRGEVLINKFVYFCP
jgi:hypothetical protein